MFLGEKHVFQAEKHMCKGEKHMLSVREHKKLHMAGTSEIPLRSNRRIHEEGLVIDCVINEIVADFHFRT